MSLTVVNMDKNFYYAAFFTLLIVGAFTAPCMALNYSYAGGIPYYIPSGSDENYYSAYVVEYDYDNYAYSSSVYAYNAYVKPNYEVKYEHNYGYDYYSNALEYIVNSKITLYDVLWQEENRPSKAYYLSSDTVQKLNRFINAAEDITGQKYDYIYNQRQNNNLNYGVISNIRINVGRMIAIAQDMQKYAINRKLVYDMNSAAVELQKAVKKI